MQMIQNSANFGDTVQKCSTTELQIKAAQPTQISHSDQFFPIILEKSKLEAQSIE